jgi:ribosomal protein S18 acetylase RimI-like enzyme
VTVLFAILPPNSEFRKFGYTFISEDGKFRCLGMTVWDQNYTAIRNYKQIGFGGFLIPFR